MDFNLVSPLHAQMIEQGYIRTQQHPDYPELWLLNYTERAQFDRVWNEATLTSRGLVVDNTGRVVARPFRKFFNASEHDSPFLPDLPVGEDFVAFEKMDGSLGVCFHYKDQWHVCTRGSFTSEQAQFATQFLRERHALDLERMDRSVTHLFEIIYPENRIVVNYGDAQKLVLLGGVERWSGEDLLPSNDRFEYLSFSSPKVFKARDLSELPNDIPNFEGFVVRFSSGLRAKVKLDEYVRLHRIATSWSDKNTWESLKNGDDLDAMLVDLPDEMFEELQGSIDRFRNAFSELKGRYLSDFESLGVASLETRKEQAQVIVAHCREQGMNTSAFFALLDGNGDRADSLVWDCLQP